MCVLTRSGKHAQILIISSIIKPADISGASLSFLATRAHDCLKESVLFVFSLLILFKFWLHSVINRCIKLAAAYLRHTTSNIFSSRA